MKAWRDLGFVQDSDDDGEELSDESQPHWERKTASKTATTPSCKPTSTVDIGPECPDLGSEDTEPSDVSLDRLERSREQWVHLRRKERDGHLNGDDDLDELQMDEYPPPSDKNVDESPQRPSWRAIPTLDSTRQSIKHTNVGKSSTLEATNTTTEIQGLQLDTFLPPSLGETPIDGVQAVTCSQAKSNSQVSGRQVEVQVVIPSAGLRRETPPSRLEQEEDYTFGTRSLRERKAIQLNPYTIEQQKHKQTMNALGVRSVRVQMPSQQKRGDTNDEDEEYSSSRSPSPVFRRGHSHSTGQTSVPSSPPRAPKPVPPSISDDDESLPDLDTLLRTSDVVGSLQRTHKRRKTHHLDQHRTGDTVFPTEAVPLTNSGSSRPNHDGDIFNVPPSPPVSAAQSPSMLPQRRAVGFLYPPGLISQPLPSPRTSSSARIHIEHEYMSNEASDRNVQPLAMLPTAPRHTVDLSEESSGEDTSDSSRDTSQEIKGIQRRIKGVLPASWLKLDLRSRGANKKIKKTPLKLPTFRQNSLEPHAGVAQKRTKATVRASSPPSPVPVVDSDDSESESDSGTFPFGTIRPTSSTSKPSRRLSPIPWTRFDEDPGIQMEDNFVDIMIPSISRPNRQSRRGSKRQIKLKDACARPLKRIKSGTKDHMANRNGTASTRATARPFKSRPRPPQLSIVDNIVADDGELSSSVPQFLKIAARQARQQPDHGRHSPTTKHIRLQTRHDTEEATEVLRDWRLGKMNQKLPSQQSRGELRLPLAERGTNHQHHGPRTTVQQTLSNHTQRNSTPAALRLRQSKLQPLVLQKSNQRKPPLIIDERSSSRAPRSLQSRTTSFRPAQLELDEADLATHHDRLQFQRGLHNVNREFDAHRETFYRNPQLEAFINDRKLPAYLTRPVPPSFSKTQPRVRSTNKNGQVPNTSLPVPRKPRKRLGRRLDVETKEYRQPVGLPVVNSRRAASVELSVHDHLTLQDLGPFGTQFTTNFDIFPLPLGTYLHGSTLIGSGEFRRAISMDHRNFDVPTARHVAVIGGRSCIWSQWDNEMATSVHDIFSAATATLEDDQLPDQDKLAVASANIVSLLRQVIELNSNSLSFYDPVDRVSCIEKFLNCLEPLFISTVDKLESIDSQTPPTHCHRLLFRAVSLQLVLTQQILVIGLQSSACEEVCTRAQSTVRDMCNVIWRYLSRHGFQEARDFLDQNQRPSVREAGIRDDTPAVEAILILWHICNTCQFPSVSFWNIFNTEIGSGVAETIKLGILEQKWYNLFTVLPLLELDSSGVLQVGHRLQKPHDNWDFVRQLLSRVFSLYPATANTPGTNINKYIRCLLVRCHLLIRGWGWRQCEPIIGLVFDFFARNKLAPLQNEENPKSPHFLEVLDQHPSLDTSLDDTSFHTFLKIVGAGLRGMSDIYPNNKIRSIAWRCIPNHGRTYRNDEEMQSNDLAALRNNHDLLCTLYWASPPGFRLRVDTIHNLVEHSTSHRAACRLNIKAWANLVKFQLSTNEAVEVLDPFILWFKDIVDQCIILFKRAPSEAQEEYEKARKAGNTSLSHTNLERIISRNQNNVLASLVDVTVGMKTAIASARATSSATHLLQASGIDCIFGLFGLFSSKKTRTNVCITEVLHVYVAIIDLQSNLSNEEQSQSRGEESQDYGAWPDLELDAEENAKMKDHTSTTFIFESLAQFLSTSFGAEPAPDDTLLTAVVDTWTRFAFSAVRTKEKDWESFLDNYSPHSWNQLRDTEQTRKFAPYFLAKIAMHDRHAFFNNRSHFLSVWLSSLVERDSQLKFQNHLTTALLSIGSDDPLLQNLPFLAAPRGSTLNISTTELRERRLALISSILANMRNHFHDSLRNKPEGIQELRTGYMSLLKQVMAAMKKNFLELQQGEKDICGSYVNFVHKAVEFLQQYTSDICAVDVFFTDSNIFPLPANDPKYVVGRLKGYGAKLADAKAMKQLASFLLNVSSRAAVDQEQPYLTEQLHTAMSCTFESGDSLRPSLRSILLEGIFPSYIQTSLSTPCGWIMAEPILKACANMFRDFIYDFSVTKWASVSVALKLLSSTLLTLQETIAPLSIHPEFMQHGHVLRTLAAIFRVVTSLLPSLNYIIRRTSYAAVSLESLAYIKAFTIFVAHTILGHADALPPLNPEEPPQEPSAYKEIRSFCLSQVKDELKKWRRDGEQYSVCVHTNNWRVIDGKVGSIEEEKEGAIIAIEEFHTVLAGMKALV
jgi:hypothetical protein